MEKLEIVQFEEQNIQLYSQKGELLMTMEELAEAVGFANITKFKDFLQSREYMKQHFLQELKKLRNLESSQDF